MCEYFFILVLLLLVSPQYWRNFFCDQTNNKKGAT